MLGAITAQLGGRVFPPPITNRTAEERADLARSFQGSAPVRHVVIDGFLDADVAQRLLDEFPRPEDMPKSRDYVFSDKRELSTLDRHTETSHRLHDALVSSEFTGFLGELVGRPVFLDPEYVGGGFHAGAPGSYLDLHTDFNLHPVHQDWHRMLNILIYLNPDWDPAWGGQLQLTDDPGREGIEVEPLFNRAVIMESTDSSYHGYERLEFPEGTARRSLAAYAYETVADGSIERRTTNWVPQEAGTAKRVLARNWNRIVLTKNRFLGSGTVKNRR
jgi:Rps23 Pro-64 3,4-dihydroxylase Tpa1-like proline 4-hydroxylase